MTTVCELSLWGLHTHTLTVAGFTSTVLLCVFTLIFQHTSKHKSELFELQRTQQFLHLNSFLEKKPKFPKSRRMMAKHFEKVLQLWASVLVVVREKLLPCKNKLRFNLKSLCSHQESATAMAWLACTAVSGGQLSLLLRRIFFMNSLFWL